MLPLLIVLFLLATPVFAQRLGGSGEKESNDPNMMDKIYKDESHCLTSPEIRNDKDSAISCFCRDAVEDARYVYLTYIHSGKDKNLNGAYLALEQLASEQCGKSIGAIIHETMVEEWKWNGPEVVRTYPSDEVIDRISPDVTDGKPVGRWVPFTVQLVYRDAQGHVVRTENYASREYEPVFPK